MVSSFVLNALGSGENAVVLAHCRTLIAATVTLVAIVNVIAIVAVVVTPLALLEL